MLFKDEVKDIRGLAGKLKELGMNEKVKICVMCFLFDKNNKLILTRRGPGARDEVGMLQAIGGSINASDLSLRDSLKRELREEAGNSASIKIHQFIGAIKNQAYDKNSEELVDWILLAYTGTLESGELINSEPDRCVCFEKKDLFDYKEEDVSKTTWFFMDELKNQINGERDELSKM